MLPLTVPTTAHRRHSAFLDWRAAALVAAVLLVAMAALLSSPLTAQGGAVLPSSYMEDSPALRYAYQGATLVILCMSLVLWFWLKDRIYLHGAAMFAVSLVYTAMRYSPEPFIFFGGLEPDDALGAVYCAHCVVATNFFSQLFEFRRHWIWAERLFAMVSWFNAFALITALAGAYAEISRPVMVMALLSTLFGAIFVLYLLLVRKQWQYLPAALSYAAPTAVGIFILLQSQALIAPSDMVDTPTLRFASRITAVLLLAVAMVYRTREAERALHQERSQALSRALASERLLEAEVASRTSALVQAKQALQTALHNERDMRQEQRQFFNMINHEFRTPLMVVDSAATDLQTFPSTEAADLQQQGAQIRRACRRLMALVDNCLVNERLDTHAFEVHKVAVEVEDLLDSPAELVLWSKRHQLHLDLDNAPASWNCDPVLVKIALSNLVDNAIKYAKSGRITVAAIQDSPGILRLSVCDQGPGLTAEAAERVFERYERGVGTDQTTGFGLGLWVTRRIARLHGGDLQVSSSAKGGTCFTLTLCQD